MTLLLKLLIGAGVAWLASTGTAIYLRWALGQARTARDTALATLAALRTDYDVALKALAEARQRLSGGVDAYDRVLKSQQEQVVSLVRSQPALAGDLLSGVLHAADTAVAEITRRPPVSGADAPTPPARGPRTGGK